MENQDVNNSDEKPCYAPTTNFPPTRAGACPPNPNPFGTIQRSAATVSPRAVEAALVRSPVLKSSILGGGGGVVLRPSLLSTGGKDSKEIPNTNGSTIILSTTSETAEATNGLDTSEDSLEKSNAEETSTSNSNSTSEVLSTETRESDHKQDESALSTTIVEIESPTTPEGALKGQEETEVDKVSSPVKVKEAKSNGTSVPIPTFVFGSNLGDRVENAPVFGSTSTVLTFATASASPAPPPATSSGTEDDWKKYGEEQRSVKRKWEDTTPSTGEEEESNVMQTSCRLFTFDNVTSSWVERGRGLLRLNDRQGEVLSSRLIIRTQGTLRVMLNTPVFHGMMTTRASEKSIKITGLDEDGEVKVYLIQCSPPDADTLHGALEWRVRTLTPPPPPAEKVTIHSSHFQVNPKKTKTE